MGDLATKPKKAEASPVAAAPASATAGPKAGDAAERRKKEQAAEAEAAKHRAHAEDQRKAGTKAGRFAAAVAKAGLESDIGKAEDPDDEELATSKEAGGRASFDDGPEMGSLESEREEDEETGQKEGKFALGTDGRNLKVEQEGLVDGIGSAKVGKDGIEAGDIEIADGWKGGLSLGPGQQKAEFKAPTGMKFPPPKGFELDLMKIPVPLGPGFGIDITAGLEGKLEIDDVGLALEHKKAMTGVEQIDRFAATGAGNFSGEFGIKLEVAMWGGIPVVAAVRAGIRALAEAAAKLEFEAGGRLDVTRTVPVLGETARVTSKDGEIYLNLVGTGELTAALSAFLGFELFTFKGDLYELVIAKATLANLELGGRFGVRYDGTGRAFFAEPIERDYASFDWLFGKLWKARKLDKAKAGATESKADLAALEDISKRLDVEQYLKDLEQDATPMRVANGEMQLLINEEQVLTDLVEADRKALEATEQEIAGPLLKKNEEVKRQRWAITNFFRGDIPELDEAREAVKTLNKNLAGNLVKLDQVAQKKKAAQRKFIESVDPARLDERVAAAKAKADETYRENWKIFQGEVADSKKTLDKKRTDLEGEIEKQELLVKGLSDRLTNGSAGLLAVFEQQLDAAQLEETLKYSEVTALVEQVDRLRQQKARLAEKDAKGSKGKDLDKQVARAEAEHKKASAAWEKAAQARRDVARKNPVTALNEQLAKAQARKMLLDKRYQKVMDDAADEHNEQRQLLHGSGVGKAVDEKGLAVKGVTAFKRLKKKDDPKAA